MNPEWLTLADQICNKSKLMFEMGLVSGTAGNISCRIPGEQIAIITPSGIPYEKLSAEDMTVVDLDGQLVEGKYLPSSETPMHTYLLRMFPAIQAVVHTHSPYATAFSVLREPIPVIALEGLGVNAVRVEVSHFQIPGTLEIGKAAYEALSRNPDSRGILLANHGVLTIGNTLDQAFSLAASIEWEAKIYAIARSAGKPVALTEVEVDQIKQNYSALRVKNQALKAQLSQLKTERIDG